MQDFEVTCKIRNHHLRERRRASGMGLGAFCEACGVHPTQVCGLESMTKSPKTKDGRWTKAARMLAEYFGVLESELFPDSVLRVGTTQATVVVDAADLGVMLERSDPLMIESEQSVMEAVDTSMLIDLVLGDLSSLSDREQMVIRFRFGIDGVPVQTLAEIATRLGVQTERIRQIEGKALYKLRNRVRARGITIDTLWR